MKGLLKVFLVCTLSSVAAFAAHHEQPTVAPVEIWTCNLNEGKTLDDVRKVSNMVAKVTEKLGIPTAQWLFSPFTGSMDTSRFMLMTGWSDFNGMGKGFDGFFIKNAGAEVMVEWAATATCESRNLLLVENTFNQIEG